MKEDDFGSRDMEKDPLTLCMLCPTDELLLGGDVGTYQKWTTFDPKQRHCIEPIRSGIRYSIVLFTPGRFKSLTPSQRSELRLLGFPDEADVVSFPYDPGIT